MVEQRFRNDPILEHDKINVDLKPHTHTLGKL